MTSKALEILQRVTKPKSREDVKKFLTDRHGNVGAKFCKDCKHLSTHDDKCKRTARVDYVSLVSGIALYSSEYAAWERLRWLPWHCGKKARYFEPKSGELK